MAKRWTSEAAVSCHHQAHIFKGQETGQEAWLRAGEWRCEQGWSRWAKHWWRPLHQDTALSQSDRGSGAGPEGLGRDTQESFHLYSKDIFRRSSLSVFLKVGHDPLVGHRINVVGTYQHLKMWNRRKLRQKMPVRRFVCSKGEVVCVLGCMHEQSGLWGPETVQWKEFPEEHPAPTLLRRHSWLSSSPLPSKQGKDRGHWAELLPRLRCRDQAKLKMAPGCGAGLQMNDPGEVPQKSKWVETKHKTKLPLPGWEGKV